MAKTKEPIDLGKEMESNMNEELASIPNDEIVEGEELNDWLGKNPVQLDEDGRTEFQYDPMKVNIEGMGIKLKPLNESPLNANAYMPPKLQIIVPDDNSRSIDISLDQLRETRTFADAYGFMPKQFPIEHHGFITKILNMAEEAKASPSIGQILVSVKDMEKISPTEAEAKGLDKNDAENTRVKVIIGRIDLGNQYARKLWNLAIGFMYNEKGIEICIGTNISICSNLTIYGEAKHYKNYGAGSVTVPEMFQHIEEWLQNLEGIDLNNSELLERMDAVEIDWKRHGNEFIGQCLREAVRKNYHKGESFPLTMGQVNKMTSYIIGEEQNENTAPTLYLLYNAGTYVLTHSDDLQGKFSNIKEFTHWFEQEWLIPFEQEGIE